LASTSSFDRTGRAHTPLSMASEFLQASYDQTVVLSSMLVAVVSS
jgi:hypothetical protein